MIVNLTLTTSIESRIGTHNHNVANATPPPCCKACRADQSYRRKDLRSRGLRFFGQCDVTKQLLVMRQAIVLVLASYYLDNDQLSLRAATTSHGSPIVDRDVPNAPALSHTTLYRWLTWLAAMTVSLATGCDLFLQAEPSSTVHRFDGPVAPRKARSQWRLQSLSIARRLLYLRSRWDSRFKNEPFFPHFATGCRSP